MNLLPTIAKHLEIPKDWITEVSEDRLGIFRRIKRETIWLATITQYGSNIHVTTHWHVNIAIPLSDPNIYQKTAEIIARDYARYKELDDQLEKCHAHRSSRT